MEKLRTSEIIEDICENQIKDAEKISVLFFLDAFKHRSFGFLTLIFCLPSCFPGLLPPLPTFFAIPLGIFSFQILMNVHRPKLPKFISKRELPAKEIKNILSKSVRYFEWLEKFIKPRMEYLVIGTGERILGLFMLLLSCCIAIPFPFTNFIPSIALVFIGLGMIQKDGRMIIAGYVIGVIGLIVAALIVIFGLAIIDKVF